MKRSFLILFSFLIALFWAGHLALPLLGSWPSLSGPSGWILTRGGVRAEIPGRDGLGIVSEPSQILNRYASLATDASAGSGEILLDYHEGVPGGMVASDLEPGDLLLIIQMSGASIDGMDGPGYGRITSLNSAGRYEYVTVNQVTGRTVTINPPCGGLLHSYAANARVQVVRVPQYRSLQITAGGSVTAPPWNGKIGGIVALEVEGEISLEGSIDVSGRGFRGGALSGAGGGLFRNDFVTTQQDFGAEKGEGIAGYQELYDLQGGRYGRGAAGNGGGGGTAHNSGGGGGANGDSGQPWTGNGVMDPLAIGAEAWRLDPAFVQNGGTLTTSSGGGRGGYSFADRDGNGLVEGPGNAVWGGDRRREVGGRGGRPVPQDPSERIFFGGGGGAGAQNNESGGGGGAAGGLIYLIAQKIRGQGELRADGEAGHDTRNENRDGAGGGGAGGTIVIVSPQLEGLKATARGGAGGNQHPLLFPNEVESQGPGAGGGGGFIAYAGGTVVTDVSGGANGLSLSPATVEFPANGSTQGAPGRVTPSIGRIPFCRTTTDLAIRKEHALGRIIPGLLTVYTIEVTNLGPNDAFGAEVRDALPAPFLPDQTAWTCSASGGARCHTTQGNGDLAAKVDLPQGGRAVFSVTGLLPPSARGGITNTAEVALANGALDSDPSNNRSTITTPIRPLADLGITITNQRSSVIAGDEVIYEVVVTNAGPSDAAGFEIQGLAPPEWVVTEVGCQGVGGDCGSNLSVDQSIRFVGAALPVGPGRSLRLTLRGQVRSEARGELVQPVRIVLPPGIDFEDPGPLPNEAVDRDPILVLSDLSIIKRAAAETAVPGRETSWTLEVRSLGPSDAMGVTILDELPTSVQLVSVTCEANGGSCGLNRSQGQRVEFVDANLRVGSGNLLRIQIVAKIDPGATGELINTARVSATGGGGGSEPSSGEGWIDPDPTSNESTAVVRLTPIADLRVTKTNQLSSVIAGEAFSYWIEVINAGPSHAVGFEVVDQLPLTFRVKSVECIAVGGSCGTVTQDPTRLLWSGAGLQTGTAHSLQIRLMGVLDEGASGEIHNVVLVEIPPTATFTDPDLESNVARDTDPIRQVADLAITKRTLSPTGVTGEKSQYVIEVTNLGPSRAQGARILDTLPTGLEKSVWSCQPLTGGTCRTASGIGSIDALVDLGVGGRVEFHLEAILNPLEDVTTLTNTAQVVPPPTAEDPDLTNNVASALSSIEHLADLQLQKTASKQVVRAGETFTYTLTVTNAGPSSATQVVVRDPLPAGVQLVSVTASQGSCAVGGEIVCSLGRISADASARTAVVEITVRLPLDLPTGWITNTATVSGGRFDPDLSNNSATQRVEVVVPPGAKFQSISIQAANSNSCLGEGIPVNISLSIANTGDGIQQDNPGPEVIVRLPLDLVGILGTCSATTGTCRISSNQVEWDGTLAPGERVGITYQVRVRSGSINGTRICTTYRIYYDTNSDGINDASLAREECRVTNCPTAMTCSGPNCPALGPGDPLINSTDPVSSDQRLGSILIFPFYSSSAITSTQHNTRINITNVDPSRSVYLHLFFIDGESGIAADSFLCLTANQTTSFVMSDLDPEVSGYLMVIAVDERGCPINQNTLIGDAYMMLPSGLSGNISAESVAALGPISCAPTAITTQLQLDGVQYSLLGQTIVASSLPSLESGQKTLVVINSVGGSLARNVSSIGTLFGLVFNDVEQGFSFSSQEGCQMVRVLSSTFPRSTPRLSSIIPAGRSGWMKVWPMQTAQAFVGMIMTADPQRGGYAGAGHLHKRTLAATSLEMPVIPPSCR